MNDGGPAFPTHLEDQFIPIPGGGMGRAKDYGWESQPGMTLLDYMAGQALNAYIHDWMRMNDAMKHVVPGPTSAISMDEIAIHSYRLADAMLAERARRYAAAKEATR